jgi:hypothetical protein
VDELHDLVVLLLLGRALFEPSLEEFQELVIGRLHQDEALGVDEELQNVGQVQSLPGKTQPVEDYFQVADLEQDLGL